MEMNFPYLQRSMHGHNLPSVLVLIRPLGLLSGFLYTVELIYDFSVKFYCTSGFSFGSFEVENCISAANAS